MKITKSRKKLFSDAAKVTEAIKSKLKKKSKGDTKVDLVELTEKLAERRGKVLAEDDEE